MTPKTLPAAQAHPRRVVLMGFMGAGKTTVGALLAEQLGWRFFDADDRIELLAAKPIHAIFAEDGEPRFRLLELEAIRSLLAEDAAVIALGGGAIEHEATRQLLHSADQILLAHLHVSLETTIARCEGTGGIRPVFADRAGLAARYARRLPLYQQARLTVETEGRTALEVAGELLTHFDSLR